MCNKYQSLMCWPECTPYALNPMSDFTLCLLGNFFMLFLSKSTFSKNSFRNTITVSNNSVPDQAQHIVGPDLGQNCLQRLSAFSKIEFEKGKAFTKIKFHSYLFTQEANQLFYLLVLAADISQSANQQTTKKHAKLLSRQTVKNMRSKYIIHSKLQMNWLQQLWDHKNISI